MSKIVDESILFFSMVYLSKFSLENFLHFVGIRVFIVGYVRNVKKHFLQNRGFWRLTHDWDKSGVPIAK